MKPIGAKPKKKKIHYYIILHGKYMGESWAVSPAKARTNFWWKFVKECDEYSPREYDPEDFDVIEA